METPVEKFMAQKKTGFGILKDYLGQEAVEEYNTGDEGFENMILEFRDRGWTEMDWFENITAGAGLGLDHIIEESRGEGLDNEEATPQESILNFHDLKGNEKDYLQAGLGTMMQDKVDYLSEKRRLHYQNWKKATLLRIVELEQSEEIEDEAQ